MRRLPRVLKMAFDRQVLGLVAVPYSLPAGVLALAEVTGAAALAAAWPWLFVPAAALHGMLALHIASRVADAERARAEGRDDEDQERLAQRLRAGFGALKSSEGLAALDELLYEFAQLQPVLTRRRDSDSVSVSYIEALAAETYRQGLSVLEDALHLSQAIRASDRQRLEAEIADLERDLRTMGRDPAQEARLRIRQEMLATNKELLEVMKAQQVRVDELFYHADRCCASLHRARMELAALRTGGSEEGVSAVTETLKATINHAKGVQEEMKRLGA